MLPDNDPLSLANYEEGVNQWTKGELDMGAPSTLVNFVNSARSDFPANHYFLSIVDHGGGWSPTSTPTQAQTRWAYGGSGFSWDETNNYSHLGTKDMGQIFDQINQSGPIDVVFYDACLMAMFEEAYQLRNGAHYLIASENETWASFPYDAYLSKLATNPSPQVFAHSVMTSYMSSLAGYPRTMAVFDLQQTGVVSAALNNLSLALSTASLETVSKLAIKTAFTASQKFDYNVNLQIESTDGYVDLYDFAIQLISQMPDTDVAIQAQALIDALGSMIIFNDHISGTAFAGNKVVNFNVDRARGIAIYLPLGEEDGERINYTATQLALAKDTAWDEFIRIYIGHDPQPGTSRPGSGGQPKPFDLSNLNVHTYLPLLLR